MVGTVETRRQVRVTAIIHTHDGPLKRGGHSHTHKISNELGCLLLLPDGLAERGEDLLVRGVIRFGQV